MSNLVSVIVPTFNQADFLPAALDSVLAQDYAEVELIVVDDGSNDHTPDVLDRYRSRAHIIHQPNQGLAAARNSGYAVSHGPYLLFLDSDDQLAPQAISRLAASLQAQAAAQPEAGLVYCAWQQVDETGQQVLGEVHPCVSGLVLEALLLRKFFFFASGALVRRTCLEQIGLFDQTLRWGEDADLWLRIARAGYAFAYIDQPLLIYRVHTGSLTAQIEPEQVRAWLAGLEKFFSQTAPEASLCALRAQATAILHYETAGRYFRQADLGRAREHLVQAASLWPEVPDEWWLEWAAGTALDARTQNPRAFLAFAVDARRAENPYPGFLRRAVGRYHLAAVFRSYAQKENRQAWLHALQAVANDWTVLKNRGFLKICFSLVRQ